MIAPSLRVCYIACNANMIDDFLRTKMVTGLTTSEVSERIVLEALVDASHRRVVRHISAKLLSAQDTYRTAFEDAALVILANPCGGMFVSAGWNVAPSAKCNGRIIAEEALKHDLMIAPNEYFCVPKPDSI